MSADSYQKLPVVGFLARSPELISALAVVGMVLLLLVPLPGFVLDFLLALSLALSLLILLISVYITKPLDFGVFPTVLLLVTLFRLSLNVVTMKSIILHGATRDGGMSKLIEAFGDVVIGGNYTVGLTTFVIIMVINFVVITKGSGRIAEVAARFTLDAMPGKQMAIDAELNAGHINAEDARKRRKNVEEEANFYGAMDGASKFVRGDAIAAIIITVVNVLVGFIVGVVQFNMNPADSAKTFILLTVGDGIIAAIPALMVSTAAAIIVTRATSEGNLGMAMVDQVRVHPKALYVAASLIFVMALIPGFPKLSFFALAGLIGWMGRLAENRIKNDHESEMSSKESADKVKTDKDSESIESLMKVDTLAVEVGLALVKLIDPTQDGEIVERIQSIRKQFAQDLGIIVPQIQLRDNLHLEPGQYNVLLKGNKIARGDLMVDYFLAMDPGNVDNPIHGEPTTDPVYGLPAIWVNKRDRDEAVFRGYTVVNGSTVVATHITKVLREHASELVTRQDVQYIVDKIKETNPKVVEEVIHPERLTHGDVVKVMQNLLREDVSVRDILSLFECLADNCKIIKNPEVLSEQCRKALGRAITQKYLTDEGELVFVTFDRMIEDVLLGGLVTTESGSTYLNVDPRGMQEILEKLVRGIAHFEKEGTQPLLLMSWRLRQPFQRFIAPYLPQVIVLSYDEIASGTKKKNLEMIA